MQRAHGAAVVTLRQMQRTFPMGYRRACASLSIASAALEAHLQARRVCELVLTPAPEWSEVMMMMISTMVVAQ